MAQFVLLLICFIQIYGNDTRVLQSLLKKYKPKTVIEVGPGLETSALHAASLLPESGKLYLVDLYADGGQEEKIVPIQMGRREAKEYLKGVRADLIYLNIEPVCEDLKEWYLFVKGWGILCGAFVNEAVHQFASEQGLKVRTIGKFWYCTEPVAKPYPIGFSIPECKIVQEIPKKSQDFAFSTPGQINTYIFEEETEYYKDYQRSYFAVTCRKGGWDCLRHYEILANGCIPYFLDLDSCDKNTLYFLPKELIKQAMNLPGVSYLHIDHEKFDPSKYEEILTKLLDHTRKYLTASQMARYVLKTLHYSGTGKVLFLSGPVLDYLQCLTAIGLKEVLSENLIDIPKLSPIYKTYSGNVKNLHGKGMSYTKIIDDFPIDRENIEQRIANKEFELIIYSSIHRGLPFYDLVLRTYNQEKIVYLCGEDWHPCGYAHLKNFFIREYDAAFPLMKSFPDPEHPEIRPIGNPY